MDEFNDAQNMQNTHRQQDDKKQETIDEVGPSQESDISVLRFRSFILEISGLDDDSYTAIERLLAMETDCEESSLQGFYHFFLLSFS